MTKLELKDAGEPFEVTVFEADRPARVVLFAVGGGGNPERHSPLLMALAQRGCTVVAPHVERLAAMTPTDNELLVRARRLSLALDRFAPPGSSVAGVGHSIGGAMLLALAGGQLWMSPEKRLPIRPDGRLDRLALMTPATLFFQAPGALDAVRIPILAWAGTKDDITPPAHVGLLKHASGTRVPVEIRVIEGAGHFSFMNTAPPHTTEPLVDRDAFLVGLAAEVCRFVAG